MVSRWFCVRGGERMFCNMKSVYFLAYCILVFLASLGYIDALALQSLINGLRDQMKYEAKFK